MASTNAAIIAREAAIYGGLYTVPDLVAMSPAGVTEADVQEAIAAGLLKPAARMPGRFLASDKALAAEFGSDYVRAINKLADL